MDSSPRSPQPISNAINDPLFKVFLRLRPSSPPFSVSETRFLNTAPGQSCIYVTPPADRSRHKATEKFAFTRIFEETSEQRDIFEETLLPLLEGAVIGGQDGTLATLGVTGSGKTYTILGNDRVKGMTQMALEVLFNAFGHRVVDFNRVDLQTLDNSEALVLDTPTFHERMQSSLDGYSSKRSSFAHITTPNIPSVSGINIPLPDSTSRYGILISMYELYNDRIFDLLIESSSSSSTPKRKALIFKKPSTISAWDTSKEQKKVVSGLRKVYAASYAEALQIIEHGQANRTVSTTHTNNTSSRSHAFLQIEIKRFSSRNTERGSANLCIVDLAGSERSRTAEAGSINRSLMCLGQCLQLQNQGSDNGKPSIVPWRQSKLTELLFSNSFSGAGGGQGACMIVTADAMGDFSATSQILRYSALAREVSAPRISRSLSICSSVSSCSESAVDALAGSVSSLAIATDLTVPPLSAAPEEPNKDTIIARLLSKLHETESRLQLAEERCEALENKCLFIEQSVREEVADDMELRLEEARRSMLDRLRVEEEWREGYVDGKIEIMKRGIQVHEDAPRSVYLRIEELEDENERLRRELMQLKREAGNRSPSKGQIPREVREASYRTPSKGQVVKGRKRSKPLKDVLNLEAFRALTISGER